jgi:hypothetical protein
MSTTTKPSPSTVSDAPYSRGLLNEAKLGRGKGLKKLRDYLQAQPALREQFYKDRAIEMENLAQKEKMMWTKDAGSRVRRVDNEFRDNCTYTNPMNINCIPNYHFVKRTKEEAAKKPQEWLGMSLYM